MRGAWVGQAARWVWAAALVATVALLAMLGSDSQLVATGTSDAFQVSGMLLPPIEPWVEGPVSAV